VTDQSLERSQLDRDKSPVNGILINSEYPTSGQNDSFDLLVADHCGTGEPTRINVPHRRLTEEALILAVELTRTLIAGFERRAGGIEPFHKHSLARGNQSKLFLELKWTQAPSTLRK
jgi:hypothetical protein